uniref:Uncharacterized protein n=1 Tax=Mustela putorius furo TaxID=9669 RepID=M3XZ97_MUSPF
DAGVGPNDFRTHRPWQLTQQVLAKANVSLLVWGEEVIPDSAQGTGSPGPAQEPGGKDGALARPQSLVLLVTRKSADGTGCPGGWGLGPGWAGGGRLPPRLEEPHRGHHRGPGRLPTSPLGASAPHTLTPMYTHSHRNA